MRTLITRLRRLYWTWRLRRIDENVCCCGDYIGQGGSICGHGGCRSAKEYAITRATTTPPRRAANP